MPSNQQRREAAKRKLQRQMVRREQRARAQRRRLVIAGAIAAVLVIAGGVWLFASVGSGDNKAAGGSSTTSGTDTAASSTGPTTPCTFTKSGTAAKDVQPPTNLSPANSGTVNATLTFPGGPVTVALDRKNAPCAVESFVSLASQKFFDGSACHRLTTAATLQILQCGDPSGTGTGGPGYSFADELTGSEKYTTGVVAMANSGSDSNGSQFFIVYGNSSLAASYTVLGKVTQGMDVIDAIAKQGVAGGAQEGKPKAAAEATIKTVTVPADAVDATGDYSTSATATATGSGTGAADTGSADTGSTDTGTGSATATGTSPAGTTSSPAGTTASS